MKTALSVFFVLACVWVQAADLRLQDGTVYTNVTIISANPERMLIVHDGGGCQVEFGQLGEQSLTAEQRQVVKVCIQEYAASEKRKEELRIQREAFEFAQQEKGLIEFEGYWVTPAERENILVTREKQRLELEQLRLKVAQERGALEKERLETARARQLLGASSSRTTYFYSGCYTPIKTRCYVPVKKPREKPTSGKCDNGTTATWSSYGPGITFSSGPGSILYRD